MVSILSIVSLAHLREQAGLSLDRGLGALSLDRTESPSERHRDPETSRATEQGLRRDRTKFSVLNSRTKLRKMPQAAQQTQQL